MLCQGSLDSCCSLGRGRCHRSLALAPLKIVFAPQSQHSSHQQRPIPIGELDFTLGGKQRTLFGNYVFDYVFAVFAASFVGLVGNSGSGKTTAASNIVRSTEMLEAFSDGIVWLTVNTGAKERLPSLMLQLARMVYEDIRGSVGDPPAVSEDGAAYVKQYMEKGHGGKELKCLVVADNVWEKKVVSKLLETGMWVLLSTRDGELVACENSEAVGVDELSEADAESVLRKAAELPPGVRLPDDAINLIDLCGRVAMDLAFVGRWSTVRGRQDRKAWSGATEKVRIEMSDDGAILETRPSRALETNGSRRFSGPASRISQLGQTTGACRGCTFRSR